MQYVVAPYEADAQLAYLEQQGIVDAIITEDSDLAAYGCKTVLFKMGSDGAIDEYSRDRLFHTDKFRGWSLTEFRQMCILSGCDYLTNIPNIGINTAYEMMRAHKTADNVSVQSMFTMLIIVGVGRCAGQ